MSWLISRVRVYLVSIMLSFMALVLGACGEEFLLNGLSENDANEIIASLYASSIESRKEENKKAGTFSVVVRRDDFPRGVGVLKALGLPRQPRLSLNEIFGESSFAPTPFEQKVRYLYGLAQELERTIS